MTRVATVRPADGSTVGRPRRREHPGWRMVWVLAGTETISYAALFYCFAVMVVPMRDTLGATTGQLSGALTVAIAVSGAAAIPVGRWVDRHGARWLKTTGSLLGDRRRRVVRPGHLPSSDLPVGHPLQHPPPLLLRLQNPIDYENQVTATLPNAA